MTGGTNIHDGGSGRYVGGETPTRDDHLATKKYVDDNAGGLDVTDGTHTVSSATELDFTSGATVTDAGGGVAQVAVSGGGSLPDPFAVTGTDVNAVTATIQGAPGQQVEVFTVNSEQDGSNLVSVATDGAGGPGRVDMTGEDSAVSLGSGQAVIVGATAVMLKPPLAEPSDALLNQFGQVILWTTNTAGSAKLHFKMLDSDEAVVKGSVNLS